jgi:hypothetical protein
MNLDARVALGLGLVFGACGTETDPNAGLSSSPVGTDAGSSGWDGGTYSSSSTLTGPCTATAPNYCTCDGVNGGLPQNGMQNCYGGSWLPCNCVRPSVAVTPPTVTTGTCKPGLYEGSFAGLYTSPYTFVGVPIPVTALNPFGPGLAFVLNGTEEVGGEFSTLTISDGYVKGVADGVFPFEGVLRGTLDCPTKTFTGTLTGFYCVGPCLEGVNKGEFDGPITGVYDGTSYKFSNGTWKLVELEGKSGIFGNFGGEGEWNADWKGEGSVDVDSGMVTKAGGNDAGVGP